MSDTLLRCVEIDPPGGPALSSIIWLHGLGADGHDFEGIVPVLRVDPRFRCRFIFPHAPHIPVTLNGGLIMPAWYDIREMNLHRHHDEAGIRISSERIQALIRQEEERGVPCNNIVLAGFSQGGAIALYLGLRHPKKLAGIMALSTYLVCEDGLEEERSKANANTWIFQAHGEMDPMVPIERGEAAHRKLLSLGYPARWHAYPMEHQVHPEEIGDISLWLGEILAAALPEKT